MPARDVAALVGLLLVAVGSWAAWSLGVALLLVGGLLLVASVAGHLRSPSPEQEASGRVD
jgi:hypothetical protein